MVDDSGDRVTSGRSMPDLGRALRVIVEVVGKDNSVALLDEPIHRNIGDHLIQLGTEKFLAQQGHVVAARAHGHSYGRRALARRLRPDTVLVCAGGGHLGDLYPAHQRLREQLITDFPRRRIVVLPQSLYLRDPANAARMVESFNSHPDLHLFLRDRDSLGRAAGLGLRNLRLAPDMAHALYPLAATSESTADTLWLLRRDREATRFTPPAGAPNLDWCNLIRMADSAALGLLAAGSKLGFEDWLQPLLEQRRAILVARAISLYSRYRRIVSSRLHGVLLGLLLDKPVSMVPSLTGKSHAYYRTWLEGIAGIDCRPPAANGT